MPRYPSFGAVLKCVMASDLSSVAKRDLKSAIHRTVGTWIGRDLETTPADLVWLRREMADWTAARFGVSDTTLSKVRSQLNRALKVAGVRRERVRRAALGPSWKPLDDALATYWHHGRQTGGNDHRQNWLQIRLRRLMRWCDQQEIAPEQIDNAVIERFIDDEAQIALRGDLDERERGLRKAWNHAARHVPNWPAMTVAAVRHWRPKPVTAFAEEQFPASFIAELDCYQAQRGLPDRPDVPIEEELSFLERARRRRARSRQRLGLADGEAVRTRRLPPLAEKSAYGHRRTLIMAGTALVLRGVKRIEDIRSIADVASLDGASCLIDLLEERHATVVTETSYAAWLVNTLLSVIARCSIMLPSDEAEALNELARDLSAPAQESAHTISPKNRERLSQFDDPDNFARLVSCAEWEMDALEVERRAKGRVNRAMAVRAEAAIGILILCTLPVRRRALATTDWQRNFRKPTRRGGNASLVYHEDQSKTKRPQQVALDAWKWRLVDLYWHHYRPLLNGAHRSTYLFPGGTRTGHKTPGKLADAINKLALRRTGLVMNLHLWRHVMGAKLLEAHEEVRLVEELLGHVPGSRATRRYVELKTKWAAKRLDAITDGARGRGLHLHRRRERRYDRHRAFG